MWYCHIACNYESVAPGRWNSSNTRVGQKLLDVSKSAITWWGLPSIYFRRSSLTRASSGGQSVAEVHPVSPSASRDFVNTGEVKKKKKKQNKNKNIEKPKDNENR
jgi:hypothetical protein